MLVTRNHLEVPPLDGALSLQKGRAPASTPHGARLRSHFGTRQICLWFGLFLFVFLIPRTVAVDSLRWDSRNNRVHASIEAWSIETLLGRVAAATGWDVFLEPGSEGRVSVKFNNLKSGEALKRLLGDLNFALLSQPNGPAKLLVYKTSLNEATKRIPILKESKASLPKGAIPEELIITVKSDSKESIDDLAKRLGAKIVGRAEDLNSYRLQFEDAEAAQGAREQLAQKDGLGVDSNYYVDNPSRTDSHGANLPAPFKLKPRTDSKSGPVIIGLIDTPLQPLPSGMSEFLLDPIHVAGNPGDLGSELTHGTSMAETILRGIEFVPGASETSNIRILPVDVYGPNPETTTFDVATGIYAAVNAGATVINLSMGGDGDSRLLADVIQQANRNGVLLFGAAGNEPTPQVNFPAAYPGVIAVTAGDRRGGIAPYANYGSFVDVVAPGVSYVDFNGQTFIVTGTSTSTAYVSGTAAGILESGRPSAEVANIIIDSFAPKPVQRPQP